MPNKYKIVAYRHVRNHDCIYRRIGNTNTFSCGEYERSESGLEDAMYVDGKFDIYEIELSGTKDFKINEVELQTKQFYRLVDKEGYYKKKNESSSKQLYRLSGISK